MKLNVETPYNALPRLPVAQSKIETIRVLRQVVKSAIALAELKGLAHTLQTTGYISSRLVISSPFGIISLIICKTKGDIASVNAQCFTTYAQSMIVT